MGNLNYSSLVSGVNVRESILLDTLLSLEGNFSGPVISLTFQFFSWLFASQNWTMDFVGCANQPDFKTESVTPIFHFPCVRAAPPAQVQSDVGIFWSLARQREPGAWGKIHLLIGTPPGIAQINKQMCKFGAKTASKSLFDYPYPLGQPPVTVVYQ